MLGFLIRAALVAIGLWLATVWVSGVYIDSPTTLILAGILLGVVNSIVRPIAIVLTLPMTIITLPGMHVTGFWAAFWSAVLVSLVSMVGSWFVGPKGKIEVIVKRR
jgi:putative membrane protein